MAHPHMADTDRLSPGLYELLEDSVLHAGIASLPTGKALIAKVGAADTPHILTRYLADRIQFHLESVAPEERVEEANRILSSLGAGTEVVRRIAPGPRQLLAIAPEQGPPPRTPATPLSDAALITNTPHEPQIGREI